MTPREVEVLNVLERHGQVRVRQIAKEVDRSVGYTRELLDYLTRGRYVKKIGRDTYQITLKGIDSVIGEYLRTLSGLERVINKHLDDERRIVKEVRRLKLRKNALNQSYRGNAV